MQLHSLIYRDETNIKYRVRSTWGGKSLVYQSQLGGIELFPLQIHFTVYLVIFHIRQIGVVDLYQLFSGGRDIRVIPAP